ncbi:Protein kinase domain-containing protein [Mycena venus]|uniref:Protein kinase domain-containing protein n=1 Tax=Mycena venus TaxID=2733690 RepID=A0A8H7CZE7_9AGAR|nr:Protein kinase domain-containing protein [Mycena venus]
MHPSGRRASSPGPGPSNLSGASSPPTTSNPEPALADADASPSLSSSWHSSWAHARPRRGGSQRNSSPSRFEVDLDRTRRKVTKALGLILQVAGDNVLPIAAEALSVVPIPALAPAAKILDSIWKAVSAVKTNRTACLRLTDRCASLLISIQEEVARSGDGVADELKAPLEKLEQSFSDIDRFFQDQAEWSFIHLYLKRDDILRDIVRYNESVNDCITLFHMGVNLRNMAFAKRILEQLVTPQQVSLLFAQDETNPPSPLQIDEADSEDLHLTNFPADGSPETLQGGDDLSSLSDKLLHMQQIENEADRARDINELRHVLRSALNAPDNRTVTRILQIPSPDMPAPTLKTALLRELERQQHELPTSPGGSSPSPRIRTLTWPVDGIPARQVALLDRQFVEVALEALKRATQNDPSTSPPVVIGSFQRARTDIQVEPPSTSNSSASALWSGGTEITTPLSTDNTGLLMRSDPYADSSMPDDRPIDPLKAATEIRYRMSLSHAFEHLSVTLPLWTPSLVELGAVGYLAKPTGAFRTLFNCRNPAATSNGRMSGISALPIVPAVIQKHNQSDRGLQTRGIKFIDKLKPGPSPVVKRTYAISALGETAHLIAEKAEHQYFEHLDVLKKWFRGNVQAIVEKYHPECLREELFLVVGTLNARDYALLVNHGSDNPEESFETQFHVLSSRRPGQAWGYFKPFPMGGTDEMMQRICKISDIGSSRSTVLLSRLRFRPDELDPTTH